MKCQLALLALAATSTALPVTYVEENLALLWANFKATHGKVYSGEDEVRRMAIFRENMLKAARMEAASKTGARFGMTKFSDLTEDEFVKQFGSGMNFAAGAQGNSTVTGVRFSAAEKARLAGQSKNWVKAGAVTQVKDQAACGSCWAFSTTGVIEGAHFLAKGKLVSASEQELVSCGPRSLVPPGSGACCGGLPDQAIQWLIDTKKGDVVTEAALPYVLSQQMAGDTVCRSVGVPACPDVSSMDVAATISGFDLLANSVFIEKKPRTPPISEDDLAAALVAHGPVSIAIWAGATLQYYQGGVLDNCPANFPNHGVLLVGVEPDYWLVKNSWSAKWGESGYFRLQRGTKQCNLGSYAVLAKIA